MKKLIVGNWKLNPLTLKEAVRLAGSIQTSAKHTAVICPPAVFLRAVSFPRLGAQDCFWENKGPFTGQVSPLQLKSLQVKYCLVGHSEKRELGETDQEVNAKAKNLLSAGITPIVCVGFGTTVEQEDLEVIDILKGQLEASLKGLEGSSVVVAYEPVWAISTGNPYATKKIPTPEHAEQIALYIKTKFGVSKVLYGGSVNSANAKGFLDQLTVDGLLCGGSSLIASEFNTIINL